MIAFVAYVSIHLQEGQQQGKQDIKTTRRVSYLVCSQDRADGDPSSAAPVVLLPSDATGHPELASALRTQGDEGVEESPFTLEFVKAVH